MTNLKPCPFCGAENPVIWKVPKNTLDIGGMEIKQPARWHIYCVSCSATIMEEKKQDAIRNWNRRAEVPKRIDGKPTGMNAEQFDACYEDDSDER